MEDTTTTAAWTVATWDEETLHLPNLNLEERLVYINRQRPLQANPDNMDRYIKLLQPKIDRFVREDVSQNDDAIVAITRRCEIVMAIVAGSWAEPIEATGIFIQIDFTFVILAIVFALPFMATGLLWLALGLVNLMARWVLVILGAATAVLGAVATVFKDDPTLILASTCIMMINGVFVALRGLNLEPESFPSYLEFYAIATEKANPNEMNAVFTCGFVDQGWGETVAEKARCAKDVEDLRRLLKVIHSLHWDGNALVGRLMRDADRGVKFVRNPFTRRYMPDSQGFADFMRNRVRLRDLIMALLTPARQNEDLEGLLQRLKTDRNNIEGAQAGVLPIPQEVGVNLV